MKLKKELRVVVFILAFCLCVGNISIPVFASRIGSKDYKMIPMNGMQTEEGIVLESGNYEVTENTVLNGKNSESALIINGDVTIYVAEGITLTCVGGNGVDGYCGIQDKYNVKWTKEGEGGTGGGAGIEIGSNSTLTLIGEGRVVAVGGDGGTGGDGTHGTDGMIGVNWYVGGNGGAGAGGGAGGGAGIGSKGANAGWGGYVVRGNKGLCIPDDNEESNPQSGGAGGSAENVRVSGNLYVKDDIEIQATGGKGAKGGRAGWRAGKTKMTWYADSWIYPYKWYIAGGGGAGGPGGDGQDGNAFGYGGCAGGGGGAGMSGGIRYCADGRQSTFIAGGRGGSPGENGNDNPLKERGESAECSKEHVPQPENQIGGYGGGASNLNRIYGNESANEAYFTPTAYDISFIKTKNLEDKDNTVFDINVGGTIEKRIYRFDKKGFPKIEKEGFIFKGWIDENGKKITDEEGKLIKNKVWTIWGDHTLKPDLKRIKDANFINNGIQNLGIITLDKKSAIVQLQKYYNELTDEEKKDVIEYNQLVAAEKEIKRQEIEISNQIRSAVIEIEVVDLTKEGKIRNIRKIYDTIPDSEKYIISEEIVAILENAEKELEKQQQEMANKVAKDIKEIGIVDISKEDDIKEIKKKYDELSEETKKKIPEEVRSILAEAEDALVKIKEELNSEPSDMQAIYQVTKTDESALEVAYVSPKNKNMKTIQVPETVLIKGITYQVTSVAKGAFKNNKKLQKVVIGKNIKKIDKKAFYGCKKLKSVTIGKNVTVIEDDAFKNCTSLTKVTIPSKVTKIDLNAFNGCKKLKKITIKSKKLKSVGKNAIKDIDKKAYIDVPKSKVKAYKKLFKSKTGYKKSMKLK